MKEPIRVVYENLGVIAETISNARCDSETEAADRSVNLGRVQAINDILSQLEKSASFQKLIYGE